MTGHLHYVKRRNRFEIFQQPKIHFRHIYIIYEDLIRHIGIVAEITQKEISSGIANFEFGAQTFVQSTKSGGYYQNPYH